MVTNVWEVYIANIELYLLMDEGDAKEEERIEQRVEAVWEEILAERRRLQAEAA